jgi:hypothetical protein
MDSHEIVKPEKACAQSENITFCISGSTSYSQKFIIKVTSILVICTTAIYQTCDKQPLNKCHYVLTDWEFSNLCSPHASSGKFMNTDAILYLW